MASDVSSEILSAFLNRAWNSAKNGANTLRDQLLSEQSAALELISLGSIGSVGKNSASQSYMGYGPGRITAVQITESWSRLIAYYDTVKTTIENADADSLLDDSFDYDTPIYELITKALQSSADAPRLPDIRDIRYPIEKTSSAAILT